MVNIIKGSGKIEKDEGGSVFFSPLPGEDHFGCGGGQSRRSEKGGRLIERETRSGTTEDEMLDASE